MINKYDACYMSKAAMCGEKEFFRSMDTTCIDKKHTKCHTLNIMKWTADSKENISLEQ